MDRSNLRLNILLAAPFLVVVAFVVYVHGPSGNSVVINALPVAVSLVALLIGLHTERSTAVGLITFAVSATLMVALFHLAWFFDWGGTATGSSTAGLAFIFVPFVATLFAGVIGLLTSCVIDLRSSKS